MTETDFRQFVEEALFTAYEEKGQGLAFRTWSFEEAGVLTMNEGCVVSTPEGAEFQLTIVRSA